MDKICGGYAMNWSVQQKKNRPAFTLIELLVVIAIISLLLTVVMPALKRAKEAGKRTLCLFNAKSLTAGWLMYIQENNGHLPKGYTTYDGWICMVEGYPYNPEEAPAQLQIEAIEKGVLYPYLNTAEIFRCPVAKENELRTYSITQAMNGSLDPTSYGGKTIKRIGEIQNTGSRIVFLDDFIRDWDACWMVYNNRPQWWNTTPIRHGAGGNVFSFADGHSEFWAWADARTIELSKKCYELNTPDARNYPESIQEGNPDLVRIQTAVWGRVGYTGQQ